MCSTTLIHGVPVGNAAVPSGTVCKPERGHLQLVVFGFWFIFPLTTGHSGWLCHSFNPGSLAYTSVFMTSEVDV